VKAKLDIEEIAELCHETNRAICEASGDMSQKPWGNAEVWQRQSAVQGVEFRIANPDSTAKDQHDAWSRDKVADGWKYGEVKDPAAKTHPCLVDYEQLPIVQQVKDHVFAAIVVTALRAE
jgi:RyR domain-containing protein